MFLGELAQRRDNGVSKDSADDDLLDDCGEVGLIFDQADVNGDDLLRRGGVVVECGDDVVVAQRMQLLKNFGLPGDLSPRSRFVALSLTMAAGAMMVLGGYSGAEQRWTSAAALALIGGLLISGAFVTVVRGSVQDHRPNGVAPYGIRVASPGGYEKAPPVRKRPMV